jgi:hypothetical protein
MKKWYVWLILLIIPFCSRAENTDSLSLRPQFHVWKFETSVSGSLSHTGYSTALTGMARWKKVGFAAGWKMVVNQAYVIKEAPAGIVTGFYFFPNSDGERITAFMNIDYQATFNGNGNMLQSMFRPGNTVHEYSAGYGFNYRLGKRVKLLSSLNAGRYTQVLYNPVLDKKSVYSGFNTIVRFGVNYTFMR